MRTTPLGEMCIHRHSALASFPSTANVRQEPQLVPAHILGRFRGRKGKRAKPDRWAFVIMKHTRLSALRSAAAFSPRMHTLKAMYPNVRVDERKVS